MILTFFKSFYKHHFITFFIIVNILLIFSQTPMIMRFLKTPQDRIYPFVHTDWAHDYYLYLAAINQGLNGDWLYHDPYTTEPSTKGIFYIFFTATGQIGRLFHLNLIITYHLLTLISFEMFMIFTYLISQTILGKKYAFWGALFSIIGTISPTLIWNFKIDFPINMPWWIMLDASERLYALPHYNFAQALLLAAIILLIKFFRTKKLKYAYFSSLIIFISGLILPSVLIPAVTVLPASYFLYLLINFHKTKKISLDLNILIGISLAIITTTTVYLIIKSQVQAGFPWDQWTKWGLNRWNFGEPAFDKTFLLSFGILPILSLPAIIEGFKKNNRELIFISLWAIVPFILLPFATPLEIAKIRLAEVANFVPFGILAAYTIFKMIPKWKYPIIAVLLLTILPVSWNLLNQRIHYVKTEPVYDHIYIPKTSYEAIEFIQKSLPKNSIILSHEKYGIIIPAFAPTISYFGHVTQTMNYFAKEKNVIDFYSGKWSAEEAKDFLTKKGISFIYYGWQEKELGNTVTKYPFLISIFQNKDVTIFQTSR